MGTEHPKRWPHGSHCVTALGTSAVPCSDRDVGGNDGAIGAVLHHAQAVGALWELGEVVIGVDEVDGHSGCGAAVCGVPCVISNELWGEVTVSRIDPQIERAVISGPALLNQIVVAKSCSALVLASEGLCPQTCGEEGPTCTTMTWVIS